MAKRQSESQDGEEQEKVLMALVGTLEAAISRARAAGLTTAKISATLYFYADMADHVESAVLWQQLRKRLQDDSEAS